MDRSLNNTRDGVTTRGLKRSGAMSLVLAMALGAGLAFPTLAQAAGDAPTEDSASSSSRPTNKALLSDFLHFVLIDNDAAAGAYGQELLDRKLSNVEMVTLVESLGDVQRFDNTVARAMRNPKLASVAGDIQKSYDKGQLERARDPEQVAKNIEALTGSLRGKLRAIDRLKYAGEYAMPQLLGALLDANKPERQFEVRKVISEMGRQAVIPLSTALLGLRPEHQETVADVLGTVPHRHSIPFLSDVAANSTNSRVADACRRAITKLGGDSGLSAGDLYVQLADLYYDERPEVTSFPGEDDQLLWTYDPRAGLLMTAIKSPVFHEAMTMRLAEHALDQNHDSQSAVALWVGANLRREIQSPEGYDNPAYATTGDKARRDAMYYAVAAGPRIDQVVLSRAMAARNAPLARRSIDALAKTSGASAMTTGEGLPLAQAVAFPNRRVQFEAALAIAGTQPTQTFPGVERVVPTLASAIRETVQPIAAVLAPDAETQQSLRKMLADAGYRVIAPGSTVNDLAAGLAEVPTVDVIVIHDELANRTPDLLGNIRADVKLVATPVLALSSNQGYIELNRRYSSDPLVQSRPLSIAPSNFAASLTQLMETASGGPITADEAKAYSARSVTALRDLAISGNTTLNIADATTTLIGVLTDDEVSSTTRVNVAEILSRVNVDRAQRALMDAALKASGDERVALLTQTAESARRFGNMLESRHVRQAIELSNAQGDEGTAAAALMGALNVPNTDLVPLILNK
ncbi:MAG: hypothetical protein AB7Q00_12335 [Phycisphaerales bacterium]